MSRNAEEMEEFRNEMLQEAREDEYHENKMYSDEDYALEYFQSDLYSIVEDIMEVQKSLREYGWEFTLQEIMDTVI